MSVHTPPPVVTLSATFGSLGSVIGPRVADLLKVPFLDRAIPAEVAQQLAVSLEEAKSHDDYAEHGLGRALATLARVPLLLGAAPVEGIQYDECRFKDETERVLHAHVRAGGVILGRAGAIVLADHPDALHVRLDGPVEARIAEIQRRTHLDQQQARQRQVNSDRAREAYIKHFYRRDPRDPDLYHLILDSTALGEATCVELIVIAVRARQQAPVSHTRRR